MPEEVDTPEVAYVPSDRIGLLSDSELLARIRLMAKFNRMNLHYIQSAILEEIATRYERKI